MQVQSIMQYLNKENSTSALVFSMGRQVSSKMCACFLCIMRRQFEDLFICEKRHPKSGTLNLQKKTHAKIGMLNLQNEAAPMCKKTTRKNWHLKSAKTTHAKIGTLNRKTAVSICKKSTYVYLQKKYVQKLAR